MGENKETTIHLVAAHLYGFLEEELEYHIDIQDSTNYNPELKKHDNQTIIITLTGKLK